MSRPLSTTHTSEEGTMHTRSLLCHKCGRHETDPLRGSNGILARGWWAQAITSQKRHLCGACYQELDAMAREVYWRRQPIAVTVVDPSPSPHRARMATAPWVRPSGRVRARVAELQA